MRNVSCGHDEVMYGISTRVEMVPDILYTLACTAVASRNRYIHLFFTDFNAMPKKLTLLGESVP